MNRNIEELRAAINALPGKQAQMAKLLTKATGKKLGRAAVSKQLNQSKMSEQMRLLYWKALADEKLASPVAPQLPANDLAQAMALLARCNPDQLSKAIGYLEALLSR